MNQLEALENKTKRDDLPDVKPGDTVKVHYKVVEGGRERTQVFQGTVLAKKKKGPRSVLTVRKISFGVGVERVFPLNSPRVEKIEIVSRGKVSKSKLYYLRKKVGKQARLKERR